MRFIVLLPIMSVVCIVWDQILYEMCLVMVCISVSQDVVEAINEAAFIASPYPVVLSFENHCSIPQQQEMARLCDVWLCR